MNACNLIGKVAGNGYCSKPMRKDLNIQIWLDSVGHGAG